MAKSTPSSEEGAKHPEGWQVIGNARSLQKDLQKGEGTLGNLALGDEKSAVTR